MKTISLNRDMNATFKQVQLLPALTPAMLLGEFAPQTFRPTRPTQPAPARVEIPAATPHAAAHRLPRPVADQGTGESALFAVLALSTVLGLGQSLAPVLHWAPSLPSFTAWVAQLLG
jgi:hypothetical protein